MELARGFIDRAEEIRHNPTVREHLRKVSSTLYFFVKGQSVLTRDDHLIFAVYQEISPEYAREALFCGLQRGQAYFAVDIHEENEAIPAEQGGNQGESSRHSALPAGSWSNLREGAHLLTDDECALGVLAVSVLNWRRSVKFCEICGNALSDEHSGWEKSCSQGHTVYPRHDPAVIMAIYDKDDRLLLGRNAAWGPGRLSVLAGFVEAGESLENAVKREVYEETHIHVSSIEYAGSQPWPFPRSLMLAFHAHTDQSNEDIAVDGTELAYAHFYSRDEFLEGVEKGDIRTPSPTSVARHLIEEWLNRPLDELPWG